MLRWVICPVDVEEFRIGDPVFDRDGNFKGNAKQDRRYERSRILTLRRSQGLKIGYSAWRKDGFDWCVCLVRTIDAPGEQALSDDPEIIDLFEEGYEDEDGFLAQRLSRLRPPRRVDRFKQLLSEKGVDSSGLTDDSPLWEWLERLGDLFDDDADLLGREREITDYRDGTRKMINTNPDEQRRVLGEKIIGHRPKGTWVRG